VHIVPEWYYLPLYAVLRSIPDKLGGVIVLALCIIVLFLLGASSVNLIRSIGFRKYKFFYWFFIGIVIMLGYLGACSLSEPFITVSRILTVLYFLFATLIFDNFDNIKVYNI
jgi:ubiquinol-cytochrome c reductase cytochrome b subunit